jgi:hypothetical protein
MPDLGESTSPSIPPDQLDSCRARDGDIPVVISPDIGSAVTDAGLAVNARAGGEVDRTGGRSDIDGTTVTDATVRFGTAVTDHDPAALTAPA